MNDRLRRLSSEEVEAALEDDSAPTVVGVLLAAGSSTRFGAANKLLASVNGEPLVRRTARALRAAGLPSIAVLGHESEAVREALDGLDCGFVENEAHERGLSTSVRVGVDAAAERGADAVVFLPGDMPAVTSETIDLLVDAYRAGLTDAVAASYRGQRGNPVLFDRQYFDALRSVAGDTGGRGILLDSDRGALVETDDPGVVTDIDTRSDLERR